MQFNRSQGFFRRVRAAWQAFAADEGGGGGVRGDNTAAASASAPWVLQHLPWSAIALDTGHKLFVRTAPLEAAINRWAGGGHMSRENGGQILDFDNSLHQGLTGYVCVFLRLDGDRPAPWMCAEHGWGRA